MTDEENKEKIKRLERYREFLLDAMMCEAITIPHLGNGDSIASWFYQEELAKTEMELANLAD